MITVFMHWIFEQSTEKYFNRTGKSSAVNNYLSSLQAPEYNIIQILTKIHYICNHEIIEDVDDIKQDSVVLDPRFSGIDSNKFINKVVDVSDTVTDKELMKEHLLEGFYNG